MMRLVLQTEDVDLVASLIRHAENVEWFKEAMGLTLVEEHDNLPSALRTAGSKRMRLDKKDEAMLGSFVRGETYTDGLFTHHFLYFDKAVGHFTCKDAMASTMLAYLQYVGLSEIEFEKRPLYYLEVLGYEPESEEHTLESAGIDKSVKALYGRPEFVQRWRFGDQVLGVAKFKTTTYIHFGNEQQLLSIHRDLGIIFNVDRLRRRIQQLLGSKNGAVWAKLMNGQEVTLQVNQLSSGWAESLYQMCEEAGGGAVSIEP